MVLLHGQASLGEANYNAANYDGPRGVHAPFPLNNEFCESLISRRGFVNQNIIFSQ
jgi:hypothetical protein